MNDAAPAAGSVPFALVREGDALVVRGALVRAVVAAAWARASKDLAGVRHFDLTGATVVDSAGVALLAELAARAGGEVAVAGRPAGLDELRAAYRLDERLAFAAA